MHGRLYSSPPYLHYYTYHQFILCPSYLPYPFSNSTIPPTSLHMPISPWVVPLIILSSLFYHSATRFNLLLFSLLRWRPFEPAPDRRPPSHGPSPSLRGWVLNSLGPCKIILLYPVVHPVSLAPFTSFYSHGAEEFIVSSVAGRCGVLGRNELHTRFVWRWNIGTDLWWVDCWVLMWNWDDVDSAQEWSQDIDLFNQRFCNLWTAQRPVERSRWVLTLAHVLLGSGQFATRIVNTVAWFCIMHLDERDLGFVNVSCGRRSAATSRRQQQAVTNVPRPRISERRETLDWGCKLIGKTWESFHADTEGMSISLRILMHLFHNIVQSRGIGYRLERSWGTSVSVSRIGIGWYAKNSNLRA